jgi:integrase
MQHLYKPRLLDQVRTEIRKRHYSYRTEKQYLAWILRYIQFHGGEHPVQLGGSAVEAFLSHLATERNVAAATQAQALAALLFLYKRVLRVDLPWIGNVTRARRPKRLPVILTRTEVRRLLGELRGPYWVVASLLYGSGLRLLEALRLRVKDIDLDQHTIVVRDGKGQKDRVTVLPEVLLSPLRIRLTRLRECMTLPRKPASAASNCRMRSVESTRAHTWTSVGNMFSRRRCPLAIPAPAPGGVIIYTNNRCSESCAKQCAARAS